MKPQERKQPKVYFYELTELILIQVCEWLATLTARRQIDLVSETDEQQLFTDSGERLSLGNGIFENPFNSHAFAR